ncbi:MAG: TPM domain-containing protein [bacterium]
MSQALVCAKLAPQCSSRMTTRSNARARAVVCQAARSAPASTDAVDIQKRIVAGAAAAMIAATPLAASANEFDLLSSGTPDTYIVDDASVLNRTTRDSISSKLKDLEVKTGYRVEVATVRKLEFESDAFAFGDKLVNKWFKGDDKKGIFLVVTSAKDGALTGGQKFMGAIGDDLIDSVVGENVSIFTEEEKYNEAVTSSVTRIAAKLTGQEVPEGPKREEKVRKRTYRTRAETASKKDATSTIVLTLLFISVVVPMLQYFGYTNADD